MNTTTCSECGAKISIKAKRCPACGTAVELDTPVVTRIEDVLETEDQHNAPGQHVAMYYFANRTRRYTIASGRSPAEAIANAAAFVRSRKNDLHHFFAALGIV